MVKLKSSLLSLSAMTLLTTLSSATVQAIEVNQATIDSVKEKIVASCPVRWEDHSKSLELPTLASDDIWENADDRSAFVTYITGVLTDLGSSNSADDLANDVNTVAAECATHRTALLDLLLVKEPNDLVLSMRAMKRNLDELAAAGSDGVSRETAAKDCKAIKGAFPDSVDGAYWIDVTGGSSNDAMEVFCDMTTDGGGWTFVAYISGTQGNSAANGFHSLFNEAHGSYNIDRTIGTEHFSLGIMPELNDTEMMTTIESPDPLNAYEAKKFIRFRYAAHAPMFNFGPIPGTPSFMEQAYELENPTYKVGSIVVSYPPHPYEYWGAKGEYYSLMFLGSAVTKGLNIGTAVWTRGANTAGAGQGNKHAWFYVR